MKITYDRRMDTLTIVFRDAPVAKTNEDKPGVILDYDDEGNLVAIEILDASKRVADPATVTLAAMA